MTRSLYSADPVTNKIADENDGVVRRVKYPQSCVLAMECLLGFRGNVPPAIDSRLAHWAVLTSITSVE
jgi:hypothetical protein